MSCITTHGYWRSYDKEDTRCRKESFPFNIKGHLMRLHKYNDCPNLFLANETLHVYFYLFIHSDDSYFVIKVYLFMCSQQTVMQLWYHGHMEYFGVESTCECVCELKSRRF